MLQELVLLDQKLFLIINGATAPILDFLFLSMSTIFGSLIFWTLLILFVWYKNPKLMALFLVGMVLNIVVFYGVKELVDRPRPFDTPGLDARVIGGMDEYTQSFPSAHAGFSFFLAAVASYFYPGLRLLLFSMAVLVSISRVYIGVHFPLDILFGALFGLITAWVVIKYQHKFQKFNRIFEKIHDDVFKK